MIIFFQGKSIIGFTVYSEAIFKEFKSESMEEGDLVRHRAGSL